MRVLDYNVIPDGAKTKTVQDLGNLIGQKPHISKAIVTLYPRLTLQRLTEILGFAYEKKVTNLQEIESFAFDWMVKTNQIPRIRISEDCAEDGAGGAIVRVILEKKFYDKGDVFELENEQQLFVKFQPRMLAPGRWEHMCEIVSGSSNRRLNLNYLTRGKTTKYVSNYHPELSEKGYSKFMHNIEKHRNYISRHRVGDSWSGDFAALQNKLLEHAGEYFQMKNMEKSLLDQLYLAFENSMLLSHGNFDDSGNVLITEEDGRPIPVGEGLIPQIKRFCGQTHYSNLSAKHFRDAIGSIVDRMEKKQGNTIPVACNWRFYQQAQEVLDDLLKTRATDAYFYTKKGEKIKVGAHYDAYHFAGNTIVFMENEALTERYPDRGYGVFIDSNMYDGEPNIQMHTIKGMSLFRGDLKGMGGLTGGASGEIATTVHGSRIEYMGYRGIKVANPYSNHIFEENRIW